MGRRKKFGEESGFANVRVPKSKVLEYREAIKKLVDEKFSRDARVSNKIEDNKGTFRKERVTYRDFREFGNDTGIKDESKSNDEDDFIDSIFKEVEKRKRDNKD